MSGADEDEQREERVAERQRRLSERLLRAALDTTLREVAEAFERGLCIHRRAPSGFVVLDVRGETIAEADTFAEALAAIGKATREALDG